LESFTVSLLRILLPLIRLNTAITQEDKARLKEIAEEIGDLPTGETPEDIRAMDIIRRAAKLLEQQEKS